MKKYFTLLLLALICSLALYQKAGAQGAGCCSHNSYTQTACDSFSWHGTTYTQSGNYVYQYTNGSGCASADTLHLTVNYAMHYVFNITACSSYTWNGTTYTSSGTYTYDYICGSGCPSVDTLHLIINQPMHYVFNITACSSYTWNGTTYTSSGTYTYAYICGNGCNSVDTLHLIINQPMHYVFNITACSSYTWNGTTYTSSGTYTYAYICGNGCNSVDTLHLIINQPMHYVFNITACSSYTWNGTTYTSSGTYTYAYICGNGCNSVDTLHLIINQPMHYVFNITACGSYTWNGTTYCSSGTYTYAYICGNGCNSVDTLHLTINSGTHNSFCQTVCGCYTWNGTTYSQSGTYIYTYTNASGCPSADTLHLSINNHTLVMGSCSSTNPSCGYNCGNKSTGSVSAGAIISSNGAVSYVWKNASGLVVGTTATVSGLAPGTYTLTASDKCSTATCCETIAAPVTPTCSIEAIPCNNVYTGGIPTTLYLGYGPQSVTLGASVEGGSGFTYSWSGSGLSCNNCADPLFTATVAGTFTFDVLITNSTGCTTSCSISICVIDPRCGSGFYFCHNGNNCNLSASACAAYLNSCHGDHLGCNYQVCGGDNGGNNGGWGGNGGGCGGNGGWGGNGGGCGNGNGGGCGGNGGNCGGNGGGNGNGCGGWGQDGKNTVQNMASTTTDQNVFDIKVYPNPFTSQFHLSVISSGDEDVQVKIFDITGQLIYEKTVSPVSDNIILGDIMPSGVYFAQVIQGEQLKLMRMVKSQ